MADRGFIDTNVLVYAFAAPDPRQEPAKAIVTRNNVISVQVANEFVNVSRRKLRWEWDDIVAALHTIRAVLGPPSAMTDETHQLALAIAQRYRLNIYDSLIVSAAKLAGCRVLYTEELQDGQIIDGLIVRNPFRDLT